MRIKKLVIFGVGAMLLLWSVNSWLINSELQMPGRQVLAEIDLEKLERAVELFQNEYGHFPLTGRLPSAENGVRVMRILEGRDLSVNRRGIAFIGWEEKPGLSRVLEFFVHWGSKRGRRHPLVAFRPIKEVSKGYKSGGFDKDLDAVLDPWGVPYSFEETDKGLEIRSAGANCQFGDKDDVIVPLVPKALRLTLGTRAKSGGIGEFLQ
jgi:hypothetical protein